MHGNDDSEEISAREAEAVEQDKGTLEKSPLPMQSPTALTLLEKEIERFLSSDKSGVLCIRGKWGVGKTFAWDRFLKINKDKVAATKYAYVSLFGLDSLDALKNATFENTIAVASIGVEPSLQTYVENLQNSDFKSLLTDVTRTGFNWGRKSLNAVAQIVPHGKDAWAGINQLSYLTIKKQVICIDDLERKGKNLRLIDVLGLASYLKERRDCKVVLVLNDEELSDEAESFSRFYEKVIDESLVFSPTPEQCAEIAIQGSDDASELLKQYIIALGISNIRVIVKIQRLIGRLLPIISDLHPFIARAAIHSLALFGWAHFSRSADNTGVDIDGRETDLISFIFFKRQGLARIMANREEKLSADEKRWDELLGRYEFGSADELDGLLLAGVKDGFFDDASVRRLAELTHARLNDGQINKAFEDAWEAYRGSFANDVDSVLARLSASFVDYIPYAKPMDVESVMRVMRGLGRDDEASRLLRLFMERRNEDRAFYDLNEFIFGNEIRDEELRAAFSARFDGMYQPRNPIDILLGIYRNKGWNPDDLRELQKLKVDDWVSLFKSTTGPDLTRIIRQALEFGNIQGEGESAYKMIAGSATEALRKIGTESTINAMRVKTMYGIDVEEKK